MGILTATCAVRADRGLLHAYLSKLCQDYLPMSMAAQHSLTESHVKDQQQGRLNWSSGSWRRLILSELNIANVIGA